MLVKQILQRKGHEVMTVSPDTPLRQAAEMLKIHHIGALVVSGGDSSGNGGGDGAVLGILSERDIVNAIAEHGAEAVDLPVRQVMTRDVQTCGMDDTTDQLMEVMTNRRVRHLPVVEDGRLAGLVSIGDVVKQRMDQIAFEAEQMKMYIASG